MFLACTVLGNVQAGALWPAPPLRLHRSTPPSPPLGTRVAPDPQAQMGLTQQEICAAKWVFNLLDYNADGARVESARRAAHSSHGCGCFGFGFACCCCLPLRSDSRLCARLRARHRPPPCFGRQPREPRLPALTGNARCASSRRQARCSCRTWSRRPALSLTILRRSCRWARTRGARGDCPHAIGF